MPKEKKKGPATGNSNRHAPLGQQITDDINRSKFAAIRSSSRKGEKEDKYGNSELLNEKETKRIFDLGREQMLEIEMEEQKSMERRCKNRVDVDSSDEEDDLSAIGEIVDDNDEE